MTLLYRFNPYDESESGLEDPEHIQWTSDQFLDVSGDLLKILQELVFYNEEFRRRTTKLLRSKPSRDLPILDSEIDMNLCGICFERPM